MTKIIIKIRDTFFCKKEDFFLFCLILFAIFVITKLTIYFTEYHLYVRFENLPAMSIRTSPKPLRTKVILNGVDIGEAQEIRLTENVKYSIVKIKLYKKYRIPVGTTAKLKSQAFEENFIELSLPEKDTKIMIKEYQTLIGIVTPNAKTLLDKHLEDGTLNNMINSVKGAMSNADKTSQNLEEGTELIVQILTENRENISNTIKNFSKTSENVKNFTANLNLILQDQVVSNKVKDILTSAANSMTNVEKLTGEVDFKQSAQNIKASTENVQRSTKSLREMMENFNDISKGLKCNASKLGKTLRKTHCLLDESTNTVRSVRHLSNGMSETMSHRFLFWKFMFGKPGIALENPPEAFTACPIQKCK